MPPLATIFLWPFVMLALFKRFTVPVALCWSIFAGYLLLPTSVGLNLPVLPTINKTTMPSLAAIFILIVLIAGFKNPSRDTRFVDRPFILPGWLPRHPLLLLLFIGMISGAFLTAITNADTLRYGTRVIRGIATYDSFAAVLTMIMTLLPLLLGRKFLATPNSHKTLLLVFCISGFIYSIPTLYEIRMSPQLNNMVYGFFPNSWRQHVRGSGFRPIVFLQHGLWLSLFLSGAVLSSLAYIRLVKPESKAKYWFIAVWLLATLVLSKSLGALLIVILLAAPVLFFSVRLQLITAAAIVGMILFYPALRASGVIPTQQFVNVAASIDQGRSRSLEYRFNNEDILLDKANERPLFGWAGFGRARVYDREGRDISTTDGYWIITIGNEGWFGYLSRFGLLAVPIIILTFRRQKYEVTLPTSALALVLAGNLIDLIPNAGITPLTWLMAGALLGRLEATGAGQQDLDSLTPETADTRMSVADTGIDQDLSAQDTPVYTRFPSKNIDRKNTR